MSFTQAMAVYIPHLVSAPLFPLALLAITVLALSTHSAADITVQERQMQRQKEKSGESVALTKVHAIGFGFMASLGLLAMWMWSNVLVYMSLFTFGLGSFVSIQQSMPDIMKRLGLGRGKSWHHNGIASLLVLSWFWNRNSSHAWIFQDILGGFTISLMLKVLKAPSMSSPTLLLLTAFIYDVFFVFITPYLTSTGESIMEAAATGAALTVKETIPMLFRVPSFRSNGGEAMLGFGDVVLPGILITFLRECDARLEEDLSLSSAILIGMDSTAARRTSALLLPRSSRREGQRRWSYYLTAILGYAVGLEVTFMAMMWSNQGQPALLYLVPCTVIPVVLLASKRHELSLLWNGWEGHDGEESEDDDDDDEERSKDESEKGTVLVI